MWSLDRKACKEEDSFIVTCIEILYRISQLKYLLSALVFKVAYIFLLLDFSL